MAQHTIWPSRGKKNEDLHHHKSPPSERKESSRQKTLKSQPVRQKEALPCTLSLQPAEGDSVKRRHFPWNIRIKSKWKDENGYKREINYIKVDTKYKRGRTRGSEGEEECWIGVLCESSPSQHNSGNPVVCCFRHTNVKMLKPISQSLKDSWLA